MESSQYRSVQGRSEELRKLLRAAVELGARIPDLISTIAEHRLMEFPEELLAPYPVELQKLALEVERLRLLTRLTEAVEILIEKWAPVETPHVDGPFRGREDGR